jgi:hypothetical protein
VCVCVCVCVCVRVCVCVSLRATCSFSFAGPPSFPLLPAALQYFPLFVLLPLFMHLGGKRLNSVLLLHSIRFAGPVTVCAHAMGGRLRAYGSAVGKKQPPRLAAMRLLHELGFCVRAADQHWYDRTYFVADLGKVPEAPDLSHNVPAKKKGPPAGPAGPGGAPPGINAKKACAAIPPPQLNGNLPQPLQVMPAAVMPVPPVLPVVSVRELRRNPPRAARCIIASPAKPPKDTSYVWRRDMAAVKLCKPARRNPYVWRRDMTAVTVSPLEGVSAPAVQVVCAKHETIIVFNTITTISLLRHCFHDEVSISSPRLGVCLGTSFRI